MSGYKPTVLHATHTPSSPLPPLSLSMLLLTLLLSTHPLPARRIEQSLPPEVAARFYFFDSYIWSGVDRLLQAPGSSSSSSSSQQALRSMTQVTSGGNTKHNLLLFLARSHLPSYPTLPPLPRICRARRQAHRTCLGPGGWGGSPQNPAPWSVQGERRELRKPGRTDRRRALKGRGEGAAPGPRDASGAVAALKRSVGHHPRCPLHPTCCCCRRRGCLSYTRL